MVKYQVVQVDEMKRFLLSCLTCSNVGIKESHAMDLVDVLIEADIRNHLSHGLNRIEIYLDDFKFKLCRDDCEPEILKETTSTAYVDGNNLLGPRVGKFCMNLCIKKAKETGIAIVSAKGSNHFGINQFYSLMAAEQKLIGMTFTNGSPLVASTYGKHPFLSTNPLCLAASGKNNKFILDMATSAVALGKVEMQERKGCSMNPNWAIDKNGQPTSEPKECYALLPLGGQAETSGYKGYALGLMVELMTALLSGSERAPNVRNWKDKQRVANISHTFIAIDPSCFSPDFEDNLDGLAEDARNQEPADQNQKVKFPGDPELERIELVKKLDGIPYFEKQIEFADHLATKLNIPKVKVLKEVDL